MKKDILTMEKYFVKLVHRNVKPVHLKKYVQLVQEFERMPQNVNVQIIILMIMEFANNAVINAPAVIPR